MPKPMRTRSRDESESLVADRRIQVNPSNSLHKVLYQEPLLHPEERSVVIVDGDHHGGLTDKPFPESLGDCSQVDTQATDDHEEQPAGGELVVTAQNIFDNLDHSYSVTETRSSSVSSGSPSPAKPVPAKPDALRAGLVGMIKAIFSICSRVGTFLLLKSVQSATLNGTARNRLKQQ